MCFKPRGRWTYILLKSCSERQNLLEVTSTANICTKRQKLPSTIGKDLSQVTQSLWWYHTTVPVKLQCWGKNTILKFLENKKRSINLTLQKGHPRTPGMDSFCTVLRPYFLGTGWSCPATSASMFSVFLDYILRVCQSLWDSFLYLGKLHWFLYLLLSYFYDPGMFIFRWSSNFVEKVVLNESMSAKMAPRVSYLVYYYCR